MGSYDTLLYDERDGVATVTLNRPEVLNAFDMQMITELHSVWRGLRGNDDVRCVVLTGAGEKAFCTGLDRTATEVGVDGRQSEISNKGSVPLHFDDPGDWISPKTGAELWKPVIAAVNGMACGGAFYLLGEVEFIVASETATFFDPHVTYGMPAVYEPTAMLQRMPLGEIMRLSLLGAHERMSAQRAHEIGLVSQVVPAADLASTVHELAVAIASQPARAVQMTVRQIWYAQQMGYRQALDLARSIVMFGTDEAALAEGQQVFSSGQRIDWKLR